MNKVSACPILTNDQVGEDQRPKGEQTVYQRSWQEGFMWKYLIGGKCNKMLHDYSTNSSHCKIFEDQS